MGGVAYLLILLPMFFEIVSDGGLSAETWHRMLVIAGLLLCVAACIAVLLLVARVEWPDIGPMFHFAMSIGPIFI